MLEGASQEILSREVSTSDADQDHSAVTSGDDVSQAPEVSPIHDAAVADSESRDSDVGTAADLTSTGTERLEEVQAGWERAVNSYKIFVRDQKLRMQGLARENQGHARANQDLEDRIQVLRCESSRH